jgi:hypothetical protein
MFVGIAAALLVGAWAAFVHGATTITAPRTTTLTPAASTTAGGCCLWRIHKKAAGERRLEMKAPYNCDKGKTAEGTARLRLVLSTEGAPCDENPTLVADGSVLEASGRTIRREDGFAHFAGSFTIKNPAGVVLFNGRMELIDRIGTHHPPFGPEACNQQGLSEGWLMGGGSGPLSSFQLHALILARAGAAPGPVTASIDGALVKCP